MSGTKFDDQKPKVSLLSSIALLELAKVMTYGQKKYSAHNWRKGFKYSRLIDAAMRHLLTYNSGERVDSETGLSHLAHCMANLMMLLEFETTKAGEDDLYSTKINDEELETRIFIPHGSNLQDAMNKGMELIGDRIYDNGE